ncbi:MAG: 50S ribosomal protein L13 [Gammaproteobacteria bacterium]
MKTFTAKPQEVTRNWYVVNVAGKVLGRVSTEIARILRGKHKPIYTPHVDTGDHIIVINADKVRVTGSKSKDKMYHRHTGYPGGLRSINFADLQERDPNKIIELAVKRMLPKGPLGRDMLRKLHIYAGAEHSHQAQKPVDLEIKDK